MHRGLTIKVVEWVVLAPTIVLAQRGPEPRLTLTLSAGVVASEPTLWTIARQPLLVIGTENDPQPRFDTVSLTRGFVTNLIVGVAGSYFPTSILGIEVGVTRLGLTYESTCSGIAFRFPTGHTESAPVRGDSRLGSFAGRHRRDCGGAGASFPAQICDSVCPWRRWVHVYLRQYHLPRRTVDQRDQSDRG